MAGRWSEGKGLNKAMQQDFDAGAQVRVGRWGRSGRKVGGAWSMEVGGGRWEVHGAREVLWQGHAAGVKVEGTWGEGAHRGHAADLQSQMGGKMAGR